jgi:hypothetical protein
MVPYQIVQSLREIYTNLSEHNPHIHYNLYMLIICWGSDLTVCSPVWKSGQTMTDLLAHNFVHMHYRVIEVLQGSQINNPNHNRTSWCVHLLCDLSDHARLIKKDEMRKCWRALASNENKSPYHTYMYAKKYLDIRKHCTNSKMLQVVKWCVKLFSKTFLQSYILYY